MTERRGNVHQQRRGAETRAALLSALERILKTTPWRDVRIQEVARRARVSGPAFYQYWDSIEALFESLVALHAEQGRPLTTHMKLISELLEHEAGARPGSLKTPHGGCTSRCGPGDQHSR